MQMTYFVALQNKLHLPLLQSKISYLKVLKIEKVKYCFLKKKKSLLHRGIPMYTRDQNSQRYQVLWQSHASLVLQALTWRDQNQISTKDVNFISVHMIVRMKC